VFSTSTVFENERGYNRFSAYALLNHGGDFKAAAKALGGFGDGGQNGSHAGSVPLDSSQIKWLEPEPLPRALAAVDTFDDIWLPESLRPWIADVAERIQCPPDFPAVGAMVSLANTLGRKIATRPKQYDDWMEVPNLWGAVVGRPGIMKSPALAESMRPLNRLAIEAQQQHQEATDTAEKGAEVRAAQIKALRSELVKACSGKGKRQADDIAAEMEDLKAGDGVESCRRFKVNDATVEKLGELLAENPNGLLMFRDELVGWLRALDREGAENTRPFFLESWNGMGGYTYDRIGRGTLHIDHACLGVLGGIQPGPLSVYVRGAIKNGQGADGLLQRIQMLVWPDDSGQWKDVDRWPDTSARDTAFNVFQRLSDLSPADVQAQTDEYSDHPWLRFNAAAQEVFTEWRNDLENTKLRRGEHEVIESHLSKYRKLIPALALVIHLAENGTGPVTEQVLIKACAWGEYLESHARRVYSLGTAPDLGAAHALRDKIRRGRLDSPFKPRDIYRKGWTGLDKDGASKGIEVLADYGWLHTQKIETGGRPTILCHINPAALP
jgi:putative DNA primase/helicase